MKTESEKLLERKLSREVERLGGWSIKILAVHINGLPDRICLLPGGRLFFAEIKTTKQKTTRIQNFIIAKIIKLGFRVEIIDNSETIKDILKDYE